MVSRKQLKMGVHYFQPGGCRGRLIFDLEAIEAFIRGEEQEQPPAPTVRIFGRGEVKLDEEEGRQATRLLR